ncbi:MAG: M14 family metallocarboxypeptidase [Opitutales bacterium]
MPSLASNYRSHDYKFLLQRWRSVCRTSGLRMSRVSEIDGFPCYEILSPSLKYQQAIYLSAGIHGDETGSTEGLLAWAETHLDKLHSLPLLIYPCMNPWGLVNNSRVDAQGVDLNRIWDSPKNLFIQHITERCKELDFKLVLNLHEDFDGQGVYLYEPNRGGCPTKHAEQILKTVSPWITRDPRRKIDGRTAKNGIIRPRPSNPPEDGIPEALYFYLKYKCPTFTFETPSEFDLNLRINAQASMVQKAISIADSSVI